MTDENKILAWHACDANKRLRYSDNRLIVPGETLSVEGEIALCTNGLHASRTPLDAISNRTCISCPADLICQVELWGNVSEAIGLLAATNRRCLWIVDIRGIEQATFDFIVSIRGKKNVPTTMFGLRHMFWFYEKVMEPVTTKVVNDFQLSFIKDRKRKELNNEQETDHGVDDE